MSSPPAATVPSQPITPIAAPAVQPATRRATPGAPRWRLVAIAAALVVGFGAALLVLQWSSRAVSADGAFTVHIPAGWERVNGPTLPGDVTSMKDLMALRGPTSDGVQAHLVVTTGLEPSCGLSQFAPHTTATTRTTVDGSGALVIDCRASTTSAELIVVNHGNRTYAIALTSASDQFTSLRDGALHDLIASWRWK